MYPRLLAWLAPLTLLVQPASTGWGKPPDLPVDLKVNCKPDLADSGAAQSSPQRPESLFPVSIDVEVNPAQLGGHIYWTWTNGSAPQCLCLDAVSPCLVSWLCQVLGQILAPSVDESITAVGDSRSQTCPSWRQVSNLPILGGQVENLPPQQGQSARTRSEARSCPQGGTTTSRSLYRPSEPSSREPGPLDLRNLYEEAFRFLTGSRDQRPTAQRTGVIQAQNLLPADITTTPDPMGETRPVRTPEPRLGSSAADRQPTQNAAPDQDRSQSGPRQGEIPSEPLDVQVEDPTNEESTDPEYWFRNTRPLGPLYDEPVMHTPGAGLPFVDTREAQAAHLFLIGQRCLRVGDVDMAETCFAEATLVSRNGRYGSQAKEYLQRLTQGRQPLVIRVQANRPAHTADWQDQEVIPTLYVDPVPERLIIRQEEPQK